MKKGKRFFCDCCAIEHNFNVIAVVTMKYQIKRKNKPIQDIKLDVCEECQNIIINGLEEEGISYIEENLGTEKVLLN